MAKDVKTGDVVRLRSGGPLMTVTTVYPEREQGSQELCKCMYYADASMREAMVPAVALESVPSSGRPAVEHEVRYASSGLVGPEDFGGSDAESHLVAGSAKGG